MSNIKYFLNFDVVEKLLNDLEDAKKFPDLFNSGNYTMLLTGTFRGKPLNLFQKDDRIFCIVPLVELFLGVPLRIQNYFLCEYHVKDLHKNLNDATIILHKKSLKTIPCYARDFYSTIDVLGYAFFSAVKSSVGLWGIFIIIGLIFTWIKGGHF